MALLTQDGKLTEAAKKHEVEISPNKKNDVFAAGILFLQMLNGGRPEIDANAMTMVWNEPEEFNAMMERAKVVLTYDE